MAILPYTSVSISGYNSSPPPDDGSQTSANKVEWAKHKTKIGDPIKTLAEGINTNVLAAFAAVSLMDWSAITTSATIAETDWNTGLIKTATGGKINYPAPSSFENGWYNGVYNASVEDLPLQATASTGWRDRYGAFASEIILPPGKGVKVYTTATVWIAEGLSHRADDVEDLVTAQMLS